MEMCRCAARGFPDPHVPVMIPPAPSRLCATLRRRSALCPAALLALLAACADSPSAAGGCGRPLRLEVGQAVDVEATPECPLRAEGGAEYVLAYYDARFALGAQTQPEPYAGADGDERFTLVVQDVADGARASVAPGMTFLAAPAPPAHVRVSFGGGAGQVKAIPSGGPWSVGDQIPLIRQDCLENCTPYTSVRVASVFDGWLVLAVEPSLGGDTERVVELFNQAAPLLLKHGLPLMHAAFTPERPVTTPESGQLVVVFEGDVTPGGGQAYIEVRPEGTATSWIRLEHTPDLDLGNMLWLLAHEIAHTFQYEFLARNPSLSGIRGDRGGARWGIEGGATLVDLETLRRAAGVPLQGNVDFDATPRSPVEAALFRGGHPRGGVLTAGYYSSAPFLRDLALRRMERGDEMDAAFREVLRGAVEGWYGIGSESRRTGMAERMRGRLPGWEPADAVLTWTLSTAADDRLAGSVYRDPAWLRTGDWEFSGRGWAPDRVITAGSGETQSMSRPAGSAGYLLVRSPASTLSLLLTSPETLRWKLLRVS